MCGIGGVVTSSAKTVDTIGLRRMGLAMATRGPDDEGTFVTSAVGLIHRRLSVMDLSQQGKCPMPNEDGSIQALLNGEIYNWRELRAELISAGHHFRSTSDSEVISHGYEAWGVSVFRRMRGMFAIAIWDNKRELLVLGRDRMGEKPLYYRNGEGGTVFASTLTALLSYDEGQVGVDPDAIACYLAHGFVPATHTAWKGVHTFPSAHYAVCRRGLEPTFHRYWDFPKTTKRTLSVVDAESLIERVADDSVRRCLDSDVPVGVFLSGGVDSSLIAALAARHRPSMQSFCVDFDRASSSEVVFARAVASHLGLRHHEITVHASDVLRVLPLLVWHCGQPFGDPSIVPTYMASCLARKHVTVCLSGDGGDESFAGYWRVQAGVYAARYGALVPHAVRSALVPRLATAFGRKGIRLAAMNELSLAEPGARYRNAESWFSSLRKLAGPALSTGLGHDLVACRMGAITAQTSFSSTVLQHLLREDFVVQLPDAYLVKVDVASMAASLEVRAPFLDVAMVEAAWTLPDAMKLRWGQRKWLLKRIAARLVPSRVIYRPKMGFGMPLTAWFRAQLGSALKLLLADSVAERQGWIGTASVIRDLQAHQSGKADNAVRLWLILWLELWCRMVEGKLTRDSDLAQELDLCAS